MADLLSLFRGSKQRATSTARTNRETVNPPPPTGKLNTRRTRHVLTGATELEVVVPAPAPSFVANPLNDTAASIRIGTITLIEMNKPGTAWGTRPADTTGKYYIMQQGGTATVPPARQFPDTFWLKRATLSAPSGAATPLPERLYEMISRGRK